MKYPDWHVFFIRQMMRYKGAFGLVLLLTTAVVVCSAVSPILIGKIIDGVVSGQDIRLWQLSFLLLAILFAAEFLVVLRKYISNKVMVRLTYELAQDSLASVFRTKIDFFTKTPRGELLQRCIQDTRVIQQFGLFTIPGFIQDLVLASVAIVVISGIYWPVAIMVAGCYIALFIPVHFIGKKRGGARQKQSKQDAKLRHSLLEKLESIRQIKIFGIEKHEYEKFRHNQEIAADLAFQHDILTGLYKGLPRIPDALAPALVFLFIGWQVVHGRATIGELMTVIAFIPAINSPVRSFFALYVTLADIRVRLNGVLAYLNLPVEPGNIEGLHKPSHLRSLPITLERVCVTGERGDILKNVTFRIDPGKHVAIVGPSGSGKSTLLKILTRQLEPTGGNISIGPYSLADLDATHLRSRIGYMTQEGFLFSNTLLYNLTYFKQVDQVDLSVLDMWMQALGAEDIVTMLPHGYESVIGDKGSQLSGGQRQLIGLVRTMVKQPDLLLLDEATAALDNISESLVYKALNDYSSHITRITVTHRLIGAKHADHILVLEHGEIVEQGTHEQLLAAPYSLYARLWNNEISGAKEIDEEASMVDAIL
ncbi:ABC transporter ATP-binding protein [Paenibacillus eucommiae]|uniref:ABC-type bacteriocin/lantibiotic exporter with double-glycine peptidase domain n=1 Tax=Paenibacillus eucommiae TaxID=1355755 RepID=A0ABS4IMP4_9BACL|nr:ABC transporter ATP-binding protein [Paenibacillus eucommiae]MBP1988783.1 ABC-type bacteriocin/lantibiotic exporter with double-glycine peptidase domain [Paenibacillus eucommiae]